LIIDEKGGGAPELVCIDIWRKRLVSRVPGISPGVETLIQVGYRANHLADENEEVLE